MTRHQAIRPLPPNHIEIWTLDLTQLPTDIIASHLPLLSPAERTRYQSFHYDHHRQEYLAAHTLLRLALSQYAPIAPAAWTFALDPDGKPHLTNPGAPHFNLSHTKKLVACAIGRLPQIGIDVEYIDGNTDLLEIARTAFSPSEYTTLHNAPVHDRRSIFYRLWTLKEAYIKADGRGMSLPLGSFTIHLTPFIHLTSADGQPQAGWQFQNCQSTTSHELSLAIKTAEASITITKLDGQSLYTSLETER